MLRESQSAPINETLEAADRSTTSRDKIILCSISEEILTKIYGQQNGQMRKQHFLNFIKNNCGAGVTIKEESTGMSNKHVVAAQGKTPEAKANAIRKFILSLSMMATDSLTYLSKKEVEAAWDKSQKTDAPSIRKSTKDQPASRQPSKLIKEPTPAANWLFLTSADLSPDVLANLIDPASPIHRVIPETFHGLRLEVINNRLSVDQDQLDLLAPRYPQAKEMLCMAFRALEGLASKGGLNIDNVERALARATEGIETALTGIAEHTPAGKKIDLRDIFIAELTDSTCFEPFITERTCDEDSEYIPSQTLHVTDRALSHTIRSANNKYLKAIAANMDDVRITAGPTGYIMRGPISKVTKVRDILIKFGTTVATHNYKKPEQLEAALQYALNEIQAEQLPTARSNSKKGRASNEFSVAAHHICTLEPRTPNQAQYVNYLRNNDFSAVLGIGPAGTGKTRLALQEAWNLVRDPGTPYEKLILVTPTRTISGKDFPAVPGGMREKIAAPFARFYEPLARMLGGTAALSKMIELQHIVSMPLEFILGITIPNAIIVADEAQTMTVDEMQKLITREEETTRLIICGDLRQPSSNRNQLIGEPIYPFNTVFAGTFGDRNSLGKEGYISVLNQGRYVLLSHHNDVFFEYSMGTEGTITEAVPLNGLAYACLTFSPDEGLALTTFTDADVQRSEAVKRRIALMEAGRKIVNRGGAIPHGKGSLDPISILEEVNRRSARILLDHVQPV